MNTSLTLPYLKKKAPATAPRKDRKDTSLIDTAAFLRYVKATYDMVPVVAVQGRRHEDSKKAKAKDGRHLIAASRPDGLSIFLLNSHFKDRRAHLGLGIQRDDSFLIGPSLAVQRWKGFQPPLGALAAHFSTISRALKALDRMKLSDAEVMHLARAMSKRGYMPTVESRPSAKALIEHLYSHKALDVGFHIIGRMREGNLEAVDGGRRIKRVRRPDGLFYAGLVCFDLLLGYAHDNGVVPENVSFGDVRERLIRS
jgi:hypothetical protein